MKTAQEIFDQLNSIDENVRIDAKKASEIDKSIMETVCAYANEPGLGGGYLLLGAVRTGFKNGLPQKGQSRSTYYIAGVNFIENSRGDEENSRGSIEKYRGDGEKSRGNGEKSRAIPEELLEKCNGLKKWEPSEKIEVFIIELCTHTPLSLDEIARMINRKPNSVRYHYLNPLIKKRKTFLHYS